MRECPTCHEQTPEGRFCVRCGSPLDGALEHPRHRTEFAAAPGEHRYAPWLISTLFPHLPRHSDRHFHVALGAGGALVVVLAALRLFPVALIAAAVLMPLLTLLYFYDVDVYEGEPGWALAWSIGWGLATGIGVGLLAKALGPSGPALFDRSSTGHVLVNGVAIPAIGVTVMLVGPIALLGYRRFDETLDGATFGAATAATFAGAQAVVVGVDVLRGGLRPPGAALPWVERLLALGVATPVLSMAAIGAVGAALWLRYRAPLRDRSALGPQGVPVIAVLAAAVLIIVGAIGETFLPVGLWLAWLVVLDLIALLALRRAMHVGLLEEAQEREIGPEITCVNCGAQTASHTFCGNCGIALAALPKADQRGSFGGRLASARSGGHAGHRRLLVYGSGLLVAAGIAVLVAALAAPGTPTPRCRPHRPCGAPPILAHAFPTFPGYTPFRSPGSGYVLRYNSNDWQPANQTGDTLDLGNTNDGFSELVVSTSQSGPSAFISQLLSQLQGQLLGLASDSTPDDQLLGTEVGLHSGIGGVYTGTVDTPQGPQQPVALAIEAASQNGLTVAVIVKAPGDNQSAKRAAYQQADDVINSIEWPGQ